MGNINNQGNNFNQYPTKDKQVMQLKSTYSNLQYRQITNQNILYDLVELTMTIQSSSITLDVPIAIAMDNQYPFNPPLIYIKKKLKHNLFVTTDQIIEIKVANFMQWSPQNTLSDLVDNLKSLFEKDPPKQDKIIEEVNKLLSQISEQDFKNLVMSDKFSNRSVDDLKALQSASFQELICASPEYKKIAQNLLDIISFNEKSSNEAILKKDTLEEQRTSLNYVAERIKELKAEYNQKVELCNKFKDNFSKQNVEIFIDKELKNVDKEASDVESNAQNGFFSNPVELLQGYYDIKKRYHSLQIMKSKLPTINFQ